MKRHINVNMRIMPFSRSFYELQLMWKKAKNLSRQKKGRLPGIRIKPKEGLWISYQLRLKGITGRSFAAKFGVRESTASQVINGHRSSRRIEEALRQTLGYPSFEAMIAASRGHDGGGA
jgi:hypothetical protein